MEKGIWKKKEKKETLTNTDCSLFNCTDHLKQDCWKSSYSSFFWAHSSDDCSRTDCLVFVSGVWQNKEQLKAMRKSNKVFQPQPTWDTVRNSFHLWERALSRSLDWYQIWRAFHTFAIFGSRGNPLGMTTCSGLNDTGFYFRIQVQYSDFHCFWFRGKASGNSNTTPQPQNVSCQEWGSGVGAQARQNE